ncbi:MAG: NADH-quinone oxidoreductase subunit NuoH [Planctomycetes bacterium]|jgi:NADH-quinone oxidoreductase subunit H|nr:NADH-quinone oxidoreductase subunit NuoH [Planctomycetota bacterium]MDP6408523.1 NADH-quinone oxidoreductase subunit NuoH [Planctomycetota bacterium]
MQHGNLVHELLSGVAPEAVPEWATILVTAVIGVSVLVGLVSVLAMFSVWLERKVSGHIQCRYGPMYVGGWHGWAQSLADGVKLLMKEDMIPLGADRVLFVLAPALVLGSIFGAMAAMPLAPGFYFADINLGVFFILGMSALTTIGVIMSGWASNSKWSLYGAMREAAQVVAYEIPLGISLLAPLMVAGTFNLLEASEAQSGWFGMKWFVFQNPFLIPAAVLFFVAALAETKRAPFDLPEAESELVAGFMTEYSGIRWSFFFMEEYAAMFLMSIVGAVFFFGGFESPFTSLAEWAFVAESGADGVVTEAAGIFELPLLYHVTAGTVLAAKALFGVFLMMWVRWTLPRVRIDQVMTMGYKYLTPLALVVVLATGFWELILS